MGLERVVANVCSARAPLSAAEVGAVAAMENAARRREEELKRLEGGAALSDNERSRLRTPSPEPYLPYTARTKPRPPPVEWPSLSSVAKQMASSPRQQRGEYSTMLPCLLMSVAEGASVRVLQVAPLEPMVAAMGRVRRLAADAVAPS